jgi:hypothetical protein
MDPRIQIGKKYLGTQNTDRKSIQVFRIHIGLNADSDLDPEISSLWLWFAVTSYVYVSTKVRDQTKFKNTALRIRYPVLFLPLDPE